MAERGRRIQETNGSVCGQMVRLIVEITRDKVRLKEKKWCLESENKIYSEVVMQK